MFILGAPLCNKTQNASPKYAARCNKNGEAKTSTMLMLMLMPMAMIYAREEENKTELDNAV